MLACSSAIDNSESAGYSGGAVGLENGQLIINANAELNFGYNFAYRGGAIFLDNSTVHV